MDNPIVDLSVSSTGPLPTINRGGSHDLSVTAPKIPGLTITPSVLPAAPTTNSSAAPTETSDSRYPSRRVLRPRTEAKSYAESPDIGGFGINGKGFNGSDFDSDDEDEKMLPEYRVSTELKKTYCVSGSFGALNVI